MSRKGKNLLVISQVFVPDPAAVGQYMFDAAEEMARMGWYVKVYAADRGYDDPRQRYFGYESRNGIHIKRLPWSSFGKRNIALRLVGQISFVLQCFLRGIFSRRLDCILVTTSPPMGGIVAWAISLFRRVPIRFWVMDMNPDQAVKLGLFPPRHPLVRIFDFALKRILKRSQSIIALDAYMANLLVCKMRGISTTSDKFELPEISPEEYPPSLAVLPPWPMDQYLKAVDPEENPFIQTHQLQDSFVFLYSGNHSIAHPIATFLQAAVRLKDEPKAKFLFVGGGKRKSEVDHAALENQASNLVSLPYQPLEEIRYSLSAGDVHLVSMGNDMVGCVHPCKFYSALSLGKPILLLGPRRSHIGDVLEKHDIGWQVEQGDVDGMEAVFRTILTASTEELRRKGATARALVEEGAFQPEKLKANFVDLLISG